MLYFPTDLDGRVTSIMFAGYANSISIFVPGILLQSTGKSIDFFVTVEAPLSVTTMNIIILAYFSRQHGELLTIVNGC